MDNVVNVLSKIATGKVEYDDFYRGYLYQIRDEYAIDPYLMYVINIVSNTKHIHTPLMYRKLIHDRDPYLYFSRWYPDLIILQYVLLNEFKHAKLSQRFKKFIDNMSKHNGIFFFRDDTIAGTYMRHTVASLLKDVDVYKYDNQNVLRMLFLLRIPDHDIWKTITSVVSLSAYSYDEKVMINELFQKRIFTDVSIDTTLKKIKSALSQPVNYTFRYHVWSDD